MLERLSQIRKEKNITQASIADYCNVSYQCYAGWEHGRHSPDPTNLVKIAEYLNVSLDYLLGRTDNALPIKRPEYALAEKFATDYKQLLTDKSFQDITAMCNEITDEQRALICGYVAGLLQNWGINVQSILQK